MFDTIEFEAICAADPLADCWDDPAFDPAQPPSWVDEPAPDPVVALLAGTPGERLEAVLSQRPSGLTQTVLEQLEQESLSARDRVLFAAAWARQADAATGTATAAIAEAAGPRLPESEVDELCFEVTLALGLSPDEGRERVRFARRMAAEFPCTLERWCAGVASAVHARVVDDVAAELTPEQAAVLDSRLSQKAGVVSTAWFRRLARRLAAELDTRTPAEQHEQAVRSRGAFLDHERDGMTVLGVRLPAMDGVAAKQALAARADAARFPGDERTHAQREADVLLDLLLGAPVSGSGGVSPRRRTEVRVGVTLPVLLGLQDGLAHLEGHGAIPAEAVRELIGEPGTVLRRLVLDPIDGRLIDFGRTRYRPDDHLVEKVRARERSCVFPRCTRVGALCDLDHDHPWDRGGETSERNCHLLCRRHHRLKTFARFRYDVDPVTGVTTWTTPLGLRYQRPPATYDELLPDAGLDPPAADGLSGDAPRTP